MRSGRRLLGGLGHRRRVGVRQEVGTVGPMGATWVHGVEQQGSIIKTLAAGVGRDPSGDQAIGAVWRSADDGGLLEEQALAQAWACAACISGGPRGRGLDRRGRSEYDQVILANIVLPLPKTSLQIRGLQRIRPGLRSNVGLGGCVPPQPTISYDPDRQGVRGSFCLGHILWQSRAGSRGRR